MITAKGKLMAQQPTTKRPTKKLGTLLQNISHRVLVGGGEIPISGITADSRAVEKGDLFVAVRGVTTDGHKYLRDAMAKGCAAVLLEDEQQLPDINDPPAAVIVEDSRKALGYVAAAFYDHPAENLRLIGITGTNGKTTTSYLIEAMIKKAGGQPGVIGTVNYRYNGVELAAPFTTPEAHILQGLLRQMADAGVTHVVMEVSSHALAQDRLAGLMFDVAIFTNLSRDHLDFHMDLNSYFASKKRLFLDKLKDDGQAVIVEENSPAPNHHCWGKKLANELAESPGRPRQKPRRIITCGLGRECAVQATEFICNRQGIKAKIHTPKGDFQLKSPLLGEFNLKNLLAGTGVGMALQYDCDLIRAGLSETCKIPGRLERINPGDDPAVFVDYAHTPDALEKVLQTLRRLAPDRLICVFGCGGDRDAGKRPIMGETAGRLCDIALVTSDNPRTEPPDKIMTEIEEGLKRSPLKRRETAAFFRDKTGYTLINSRRQAIKTAVRSARRDDIVLISGKGHECYQIINTGKIFFDDRQETRAVLQKRRNPAWTLEQVLSATEGRLLNRQPEFCRLHNISTDSRTIAPGDLFLCLTGPRFDGLDFMSDAVGKGAAAIIVDRRPAILPVVPLILVSDTLKALGDLAAFRRSRMQNLQVLAVTGSTGKTTVKEMAAAIIATKHKVLKTRGNYNNLIGLPLSLLAVNSDHEAAVLEMGMNRPGEIARLTEIADPDISCITNIQEAHLEGLENIKGVARAKGELFSGTGKSGVLIVNNDDPMVRAQADGRDLAKISFGRRRGAFVRATHLRSRGMEGISFTLHIGGKKERITSKAAGGHNVMNSLAAAALAHALGMTIKEIAAGLELFKPGAKRSLIKRLPVGLNLIDDSYNANPASMLAGLETLHELKKNRRAMAILGDMLELGTKSDAAHRNLGKTVAGFAIDYLAVTGAYAAEVAQAARSTGMPLEHARIFTRKDEIVDWIGRLLNAGKLAADDWLLVKGSRGMRMETIVTALKMLD